MVRRHGEVEAPGIHLIQSRGGRTPTFYGHTLSTQELTRIEHYYRRLQEVRRYDPGYAEFQSPNWVPTTLDIARINARAADYARAQSFFDRHGIPVEPRAYARFARGTNQEVPLEQAREAYHNGRVFYDPGSHNFVRRDDRTGTNVVISPTGGQIITAYYGRASPRWQPAPPPASWSPGVTFPPRAVQHAYDRHGPHFGMLGAKNSQTLRRIEEVIRDHINTPGVVVIPGTLRWKHPVTHYYNPRTGLNIMVRPNGEFAGGWRLSGEQARDLLSVCNVW
ncbi:MAG: colicin D domain-containing protein [Reyranellaceae bacterium]